MQENLLPTATGGRLGGYTYDLQQIVRAIRRGWRLLVASVVVSLALAVLYLLTAMPLYQARARLLILQQQGHPFTVANTDPNRPVEGTEDYIPTQAAIVNSPVVVKRAIDAVGLENLPTLRAAKQQGRDPLRETIARHLTVTQPNRMANVLQVDYTAHSPEEAVRMVKAITASYMTFLEENYPRHSEVIALTHKARQELALELEDAEKKYLEFQQKHPLLIPDEKGRSLMTSRLERWDRAINEAQVREVQLRAQLELGAKLAKQGIGLWAIVHAMNQLGGNSNNGLLSNTINAAQDHSWDYVRQLSQEQQALTERYGPHYSKVQELQEQILRIQERVRASRNQYEQVETRDLLQCLEQSLRTSAAMRADMNQSFEAGKKIESDLLVENKLRNDLKRRRALFDAVVDQLKQAQLGANFGPVAAEILEPATALPGAVQPRRERTLGLALLVGLAVGIGLLVIQDQVHLRLQTTPDVRGDHRGSTNGAALTPPGVATVPTAEADNSSNGVERMPLAN